MIVPGKHVFTFTEGIGPFMCEMDECHKAAWSVIMTDEEHANLPQTGGKDLAHEIVFHHIGKRICKSCLKKVSAH